ncbi:MAG TPA: oligoribonuclease [Candidatus Saccharimonadales bacterium]
MVDVVKKIIPTKLLWVDLEMTGLDSQKDLILEVAVKITDFDFKVLANYEARVKHDKNKLIELFKANTWYRDQFPENQDIFLNNLDDAKDSKIVEAELIELVGHYFADEPAILAGNSIHADRGFIKNYWPTLDSKLNYRMLDVSSWKIVMNSKYHLEFEKNSNHRALDDIQASISELQFYLNWFNTNNERD